MGWNVEQEKGNMTVAVVRISMYSEKLNFRVSSPWVALAFGLEAFKLRITTSKQNILREVFKKMF